MEILFLGTGGCIPTTRQPNRNFAGFFIDLDKNSLLFDIGPGTLTKMVQSGIDINKKPTHIFLSHLHPDHSADFVGFMQGRGLNHTWFSSNEKTKLFGGEGIGQFTKDIFENVTAWNSFSEELNAHEVLDVNEIGEGVIAEENGWSVKAGKVKHFNSRAYRLEAEGRSIVYSGDMGYDENFSGLGKGADLAIMECSFPDKESLKGTHLCPEDIGKLAKIAEFKHIVLTHLYPECEDREEEMVSKIHEFTDVQVTVAHDLLRLTI